MQALATWLVARPQNAVLGLAATLLLPAPQLTSGVILVLLLLAQGTRLALIEAAADVTSRMPGMLVDRLERLLAREGLELVGAGVLLVGVATPIAATAAFLLAGAIGDETWKLAGQYTATYTGGGVNFAAVGAALETSGELFTAGIAADVTMTAIWMATCLTVPVVFAVLTTVARDDLPDEGAAQIAATIREIRRLCPRTGIEVLIVRPARSPR